MPGTPLTPDEVRLASVWCEEDEVAPSEISRRLRQAKSTLTRPLVLEVPDVA